MKCTFFVHQTVGYCIEKHIHPIKVKKAAKKKDAFKRKNNVGKKLLPQHSKCDSKYISTNRLTRRIGLYNQGKISYLASRCEEISSPRTKARVQEDLHKILKLAKDSDSVDEELAEKSRKESQREEACISSLQANKEKEFHMQKANRNGIFNLPLSILGSPMDVDDVTSEIASHSAIAAISNPMIVRLQSISSDKMPRPWKQSSNGDNLLSLFKSGKGQSSKTEDERSIISDDIDYYVDLWASGLLSGSQRKTKDSCQNMPKNAMNSCEGKKSNVVTYNHAATQAASCSYRTPSTSDEKSWLTWSSDENSDSFSSTPVQKKRKNSSQDDEYNVSLSSLRLRKNSSMSSPILSLSSDIDYDENAELWSPMDQNSPSDFLQLEEESNATFSPFVPPNISPLKRPCQKVETPKLFFRHKMY